MSISKNQLKVITSLSQKKYREKHGLFIAEGVKVVEELLQSSLKVMQLFALDDYNVKGYENAVTRISEAELKKISKLKSPNKVVGLFQIPDEQQLQHNGFILALDEINDPGNLGTIIRLCDWFGVKQLVCSKNTVDCYNQKVVQASMGSLTRVSIKYLDLEEYLNSTKILYILLICKVQMFIVLNYLRKQF